MADSFHTNLLLHVKVLFLLGAQFGQSEIATHDFMPYTAIT